MKKILTMSLLVLLSWGGKSQDAKQVFENAMSKVEQNYNFSDCYKDYSTKFVRTVDDSLTIAFCEDVQIYYPKAIGKKSSIEQYDLQSFPKSDRRFSAFDVDVVRNTYAAYSKDKARFFEKYSDFQLSTDQNGNYVVAYCSKADESTTTYYLTVNKNDWAVISYKEISDFANRDRQLSFFKPSYFRALSDECEAVYANKGGKYELCSYKSVYKTDRVSYRNKEGARYVNVIKADFKQSSLAANGKKNSKRALAFEDAKRLKAELGAGL